MDRAKIIQALELCDGAYKCPENCPYWGKEPCGINADILALLKDHEAVVPYQHDAVWLCGNCEKEVVGWDDDIDGKEYRYPFCRQCGQAVKWDA